MKKTLIRLTSLFLLLVMLPSAVACAESGSGEDTTAPVQTDAIGDTAAATEPETTEINAENILGPADFGGETLLFYSRKPTPEDRRIFHSLVNKKNQWRLLSRMPWVLLNSREFLFQH